MIQQSMDFISKFDPEVGASIQEEFARERRNIELIASENIVSPAVLAAAGYPVPAEGETLVVYQGAEAAGMVQLLGREGDTGLVGRYGLLPDYRGRGRGIQPMGQAVMHYRAEGCRRLRLVDVPQELRAYFARYGFEETKNNAMELSIGYEDREL